MSELITQSPTAPVPQMHLVATDADQVRTAQHELVTFFEAKVEEERQTQRDAKNNLEVAVRAGFKLSTYERPLNLAAKRLTYYEKCLAAVEAGFLIVPNMPMSLFAIRTNKNRPKGREHSHRDPWEGQTAPGLPEGEGRYVGENATFRPVQRYEKDSKTGMTNPVTTYVPDDFSEVDYPLAVAEPRIMGKTAAAMAMKVFDEVGVVVDERRGDPIVLGRIRLTSAFQSPRISFLIGWYIDTRTL